MSHYNNCLHIIYVLNQFIDEVIWSGSASSGNYCFHDHLYSTAALVDYSGNINERVEYDAYGKPTVYNGDYSASYEVSQYGNPYLFTGRRVDTWDGDALMLQYNRNRYYNYGLGRWLTQDPLGIVPNAFMPNEFSVLEQYKDGVNVYEYVMSNPIFEYDQYGLCKKTLTIKGHGCSVNCDITKKNLAKGKCAPDFMTYGIDGDNMLQKYHIKEKCKELCCGATLKLKGCGIGLNEAYMKELASGCDKIHRVCGYTKLLKYIPKKYNPLSDKNWTFPMPWNWKCVYINTKG